MCVPAATFGVGHCNSLIQFVVNQYLLFPMSGRHVFGCLIVFVFDLKYLILNFHTGDTSTDIQRRVLNTLW
jgi:hypothetical protein